MTMPGLSSIDWRDLAVRAFHTFWQAFVAAVGVWWVASGADLSHQITDVASAKRVALAAVAALAAAALSALKTTLKALMGSGIFVSGTDPEQGTGFFDEPPAAPAPEPGPTAITGAVEHEPEHAAPDAEPPATITRAAPTAPGS